jgi:hypothetical protein
LVDERPEVSGVVGDPAKRIRRREHRVLLTIKEVEHGPPTRGVSEGPVNKDNRGFGHEISFRGSVSELSTATTLEVR